MGFHNFAFLKKPDREVMSWYFIYQLIYVDLELATLAISHGSLTIVSQSFTHKWNVTQSESLIGGLFPRIEKGVVIARQANFSMIPGLTSKRGKPETGPDAILSILS